MSDDPTPVRDNHVAFARALVMLAREHGVDSLTATFSRASSNLLRRGEWNPARITLAWSEGRHGDKSQISLRAEASIIVPEIVTDPPPPEGGPHA